MFGYRGAAEGLIFDCCVSTLELNKNPSSISSQLVRVAKCRHYTYRKAIFFSSKSKRNDFFNYCIMNNCPKGAKIDSSYREFREFEASRNRG